MNCRTKALTCACVLMLAAAGCGGDDGNGSGTPTGGASGFGGAGFAGAGGSTAGAGGGSGWPSTAPNMPDATCVSRGGGSNPACTACACTPNALGGCLDQVNACQAGPDAMANQYCSAIVACARTNNCTGMACLTPCMAEITAAFPYMSGAAVMSASAVGTCTSTNCAAVCPTGM